MPRYTSSRAIIKVLTIPLMVLIALAASLPLLNADSASFNSYQLRWRPLLMGTKITLHYESESLIRNTYCSMGVPVYKKWKTTSYLPLFNLTAEQLGDPIVPSAPTTVYYTEYGIITASHCGDVGDEVYQPTVGSDNYIGIVKWDGRFRYSNGTVEIINASVPDALYVWVETRASDLGYLPPQIVSNQVLMEFPDDNNLYNYTIVDYARSEDDIEFGSIVWKAGQATGLTKGVVYDIKLDPWLGFVFVVKSLYPGETIAAPGDSGGIVFQILPNGKSQGYWNHSWVC